jgi:hypothetical protein
VHRGELRRPEVGEAVPGEQVVVGGAGLTYQLTEAGKELEPIVMAVGRPALR